jgi:hypothetical protein
MSQSRGCTVCFLVSLAWIGAVAGLAFVNWPHVPLDMSPIDPATVKALRSAILQHVALYGTIALAPPILSWLFARKAKRKGP